MSYIIRPYQQQDLKSIIYTWESASIIAHPFLSTDFMELERHNIPNVYLPNADTWVAEIKNRVIGFIAIIDNEVGAIFVDPEFQRVGVGKALMDKAQQHHNELEVEVFKANSIARKFYSKYGFYFLVEKVHQVTNNKVLRLKYNACKSIL